MRLQPRCPSCQRPIEWSATFPHRPFCSERCRLVDLGAWLTGARAIPGERLEDAADAAGGIPHRPERPDETAGGA